MSKSYYDKKKYWNLSGSCYVLRKKCPIPSYSGPQFPRIRTEYGETHSPYSVRMQENADQNNCEYGHFLRSHVFKDFHYFCYLEELLANN